MNPGRVAGLVMHYTGAMNVELVQIAKRISARAEADRKDRARQRQLMRDEIGRGRTWDDVQAEAQVSRPTLRNALRRKD